MNNERTDSFANRLAIAMQLNNINQIELSEKTKAFSKTISQSLINKYLKGKALARQDNIYILCKILNVDEAWMMGFDVPIERTPDELRTTNDIFYVPDNQYVILESNFTKSESRNYRLRMWLSDDYSLPSISQTYMMRVNVYANMSV